MTRSRVALPILLALALGSLPCGPARAEKGAPKAAKAPGAPTTTIENIRTWTERHGDVIWFWQSWNEVTRYPPGSTAGGALTGQQRAEYVQKRKDFNSTERAAYWKSWARFIDSEIARGHKNDVKGGLFNVFRPYRGPGRKTLRNNLDLMRAGRAPIGADGKALNLHHIKALIHGGTNMFENLTPLTATYHQQNHKAIHSRPPTVVPQVNRFRLP